jgi:hypothetical protein
MSFGIKHKVLTVVLSRADLAAAAGEKNRFCARGLRTLGLDVLAAHPPHHSPLLVDLGEHVHIDFNQKIPGIMTSSQNKTRRDLGHGVTKTHR